MADLTRKKTRDLIIMWQNAHRVIRDPSKAQLHTAARRLIDDIHAEWRQSWRVADGFEWPTTDAAPGHRALNTETWIKEGLFSEMGYRVGQGGVGSRREREAILSGVFECVVPPIVHPDYAVQWGQPSTSKRLQKMAESIASFVRNAKRQTHANLRSAIKDWEEDLEFLYYDYYVDRFHFAWPRLIV